MAENPHEHEADFPIHWDASALEVRLATHVVAERRADGVQFEFFQRDPSQNQNRGLARILLRASSGDIDRLIDSLSRRPGSGGRDPLV